MQKLSIFLMGLIYLVCSVSHSEIRTALWAQGLSFLSPDYENTNKKNFTFIGVTLKSDQKSTDVFKVNLTGQYAPENSILSYLNVREIYFTTHVYSNSMLHIGRKLQNWSALDTTWNLGVYQPQFKWNPLTPEKQGLTGFFWQKNSSNYDVVLFVSPLYIPDQGASYELKEGQFQSSNPWFPMPPQNIKFQDELLPIDYEILKPEINSVIYQTQYGAKLRLGESNGYFANLAGMYKPANQLALGYKGTLITTRVHIEVAPKVYFENVGSADFGYRKDWGSLLFSLLYSKPQNPKFDSVYNAPEFEQSLSWGPQFLYKYENYELFLGYLGTSGGEIKDVGPDASPDRASLSQRFLYKEAMQVQIKYTDVFWSKVKLDSAFQYITSSKEGFRQIRFKNNFKIKGPWAFWVDLLLIDTNSSVLSNVEPYKSSDQLWLGINYSI